MSETCTLPCGSRSLQSCALIPAGSEAKTLPHSPESLPEEINQAISHLKIFLEKRFPRKNNV